jgi:hypothetical protein
MARTRLLEMTARLPRTGGWQPLAPLLALNAWLLQKLPIAIFTFTIIAIAGIPPGTARAQDSGIERTSYSDEEITDGFFKIAFGAELKLGKRAERIRKFDEPVRVFIFDQGKHQRRAEISAIIAEINARVDHLDLAITDNLQAANLVVMPVHKRDLNKTIRSVYGRDKARRIEQSLSPQCLSGFGTDESHRIRHAEVILPVDVDDATFYDCAYEELLQALGPNNDDSSVPWTMFNDHVQMGFFDTYDQHLLNILYEPRIRPGMTKREVAKLLPEVLPAVRERIASKNANRRFRASSYAGPETQPPAPVQAMATSVE